MLLLHFLLLIRFGNLMVVGVTMCIIQAFVALHGNQSYRPPFQEALSFEQQYLLAYNFDLNFLLLIISVLLIAGAGNIINDYFDVKADRVNKPEKMVVDKFIKRRWAIMFNWIFNTIGLSLAVYLSIVHSNWWISIVAFFTINFLWFYSALYKRKIFVGNVIIAFLVGFVPIYVLIYNIPIKGFAVSCQNMSIDFGMLFVLEVVVSIAVIAFVINLIREIIKDMADIRGDLHLAARTVPIALGFRRTKLILTILLVPLLSLMLYYIYNIHHYNDLLKALSGDQRHTSYTYFGGLPIFTILVSCSGLICIISFMILLTTNARKKYMLSSNLLKIAMLFGMVSPLFL